MLDWFALLHKPNDLAATGAVERWFDAVAERLLNGARLYAGGQAHRVVEVECYLRAAEHPDPFTHGEPLQLQCGRWYFHRSHGAYRGGSFKGLDLTFGDGTLYGGVLLRGLETVDGRFIDGPSLLVDHLLQQTESRTVAELDARIAGQVAWDRSNPLYLEALTPPRSQTLYRTARVGLTLKNIHNKPEAVRYLLKPYRYLSEPRRTKKGKVLLVLALHAGGLDVEAIHKVSGCPRRSVQRYLEEFERGRTLRDFAPYHGVALTARDLSRLHGAGQTAYPT